MSKRKWLVSNQFELTIHTVSAPGNKKLDLFMLVEPDGGLEPSVAEVINQPPLNFKTNGKGYWVTSSFVTPSKTLDLSGMGKAIRERGLDIKIGEVSATELMEIKNSALKRAAIFQPKSNSSSMNISEAELVGQNLNGEDVYQSKDGVRAISTGGNYELSTNAITADDKKRFLLNGSIENDLINIDSDFAAKVIEAEMSHLTLGKRWSEESTVEILQKLIGKDPSDSKNIIDIVNSIHRLINIGLVKRYTYELGDDVLKLNGELKSLRVASAIYSRILPEFDEEGNKLSPYLAPAAHLALSKLESSSEKVIGFETAAKAIAEFDSLEDGKSITCTLKVTDHSVGDEVLRFIEAIRQSGDVITAFDIKDSTIQDVTSLLRVIRVSKSERLSKNTNKEPIPTSFMSTSQFSESIALTNMLLNANEPLPLNRNKLEEALKIKMQQDLKEVEFQPSTNIGTMPTKYVVPASLAAPQKRAISELIEKVGDLGDYLVDKLKMDIEKVNSVFSKVQVERIALAIHRHENGFGFVIGDGTGTGKTRQIAAIMRYQALLDEQIFFSTPDKQLLQNLWREIKTLGSDDLIIPFVAATTPIVDEDGNLIEFANGETSENHHQELKSIVNGKRVIPGKYNAVFTTYTAVSAAPVVKDISNINNYNPNFDKPIPAKSKNGDKAESTNARVYDTVACFSKFCARAGTIMFLDESHAATGQSNTRKAIEEIKENCDGKVFASATAMKNAKRVSPYAEAMRVPFSQRQLEETLLIGGEPALEAFAASLTEEGGYVRAEMPKSDVSVRLHTDDQRKQRYADINDTYAEIMQVYLLVTAYVSKARAVVSDEVKFELDPEKFKPSAKSSLDIGLNTVGFNSRFNETNKLFVACLKAEYVAEEAIEVIRSGGKALIPLESTSETNLKFVAETFDLPKFSERDIAEGKVAEWIAVEKAKDPNFSGVPDNFKDALARMFIESRKVKIPHIHNGKKVDKIVDMVELVEGALSEAEVIKFKELVDEFDSLLETFPQMTLNPYDTILNKVKEEGFAAKAYSGRHIETRKTEDGITFFAAAHTKSNAEIRKSFQNDDLDCVVMGRAGWTGNDWHALKNKPVTLIHVIPPTSADLDQQLAGRVNRTGQTFNPSILYTSTGLLVEERLNQQAINRVRLMNATSKGDANMEANADEVQLFSAIGVEAVKRYLYNNVDILEKVGMSLEDVEREYTGGANIATVFTARLQMVKDAEAKSIMSAVDNEYYSYINELAEQGIEPFGQPTLDVQATLSKSYHIDGVVNSDNPWSQPVYIANASYDEKLVIQSAKDVISEIAANEHPKEIEFVNYNNQDFSANKLKASLRFDVFSKNLKQVADDTFKSLRKFTASALEDIEPKHGKLFTMRQKYERALEMSNLLSGMKLGQIVKLSMDQHDLTAQVEGVVTDIEMQPIGGYSPILKIAVPGKGEISASAVTVDNLNITKTPLMFSARANLANDFDNQNTVIRVNRVAITGSAFPVIMKASTILKSNGSKIHNAVKIVNMTIQDQSGSRVEKVALLPKDMSLTQVLSSPMELNASQCTNYIKFAGDHVRIMSTSPSLSSAKDTDLTLKVIGTDQSGSRVISISCLKKNFKRLVDDTKMHEFGTDPAGEPGFGSVKFSKYATIEISPGSIYDALKHLEEEHGIKFFTHEFGLKFIQDFNNASLPNDYKSWAESARREVLAMYNEADSLSVNDVISQQANTQQSVAATAAAMTP